MSQSTKYVLLFTFCFILVNCKMVVTGSNNTSPRMALEKKIYMAPVFIKYFFSKSYNTQYYAVYIPKTGYYNIGLTKVKGFDLKITVLNKNLKKIAVANDFFENSGEEIPGFFLEKKLYYILIESQYKDTQSAYYLINPNPYILSITYFNKLSSYTQKIDPISLDSQNIPNLNNIQSIYSGITHFTFFEPSNHNTIPFELKQVVESMNRMSKKQFQSYKLMLYELKHDKKSAYMNINLSLSSMNSDTPIKVTIAIIAKEDLENTVYKKQFTSIPFLLVKNEYTNPLLLKDNSKTVSYHLNKIPSNKKYIIMITGQEISDYKSFGKLQKQMYRIDIDTEAA